MNLYFLLKINIKIYRNVVDKVLSREEKARIDNEIKELEDENKDDDNKNSNRKGNVNPSVKSNKNHVKFKSESSKGVVEINPNNKKVIREFSHKNSSTSISKNGGKLAKNSSSKSIAKVKPKK